MRISIEQLFYGRGDRGYGVLGTSPGGAPFAARVETLCGAVGTPGADYGGEPFLLSVPEGDRVLMICSRRGAPDSMGRETLFFHALVATKKDLLAAKADAFSLFAQGAFAAKMPTGTVEPLRIDYKAGRDDPTHRPPDGRTVGASLPCFVRSPDPAPDIVRAFVGDRANDLAWATFAFQPLDGFDVQVLPPRIAAPRSMNEFNTDGKLVHAAETYGGQAASARFPSPTYNDGSTKQNPSSSKPSSPMIKISLFANLALLAVCAALLASRKDAPKPPIGKPENEVVTNFVERIVEKTLPASLSPAEKADIERKAKESFRRDLIQGMPSDVDELRKIDNISKLKTLLEKLQTPITK